MGQEILCNIYMYLGHLSAFSAYVCPVVRLSIVPRTLFLALFLGMCFCVDIFQAPGK